MHESSVPGSSSRAFKLVGKCSEMYRRLRKWAGTARPLHAESHGSIAVLPDGQERHPAGGKQGRGSTDTGVIRHLWRMFPQCREKPAHDGHAVRDDDGRQPHGADGCRRSGAESDLSGHRRCEFEPSAVSTGQPSVAADDAFGYVVTSAAVSENLTAISGRQDETTVGLHRQLRMLWKLCGRGREVQRSTSH